MKKKNIFAVVLMALLMISAQGVEAKNPPKTKHQNQVYYKHHGSRMMIVRHHGQSFLFISGEFYQQDYDEFFRVKAPIGARVKHLPQGAQRIRTHRGIVYKYRDVLYKKTLRGRGFIVIRPPYGGRGNY